MISLYLGDSYTVGEGLPLHESFPYQAVQLLREAGYSCSAPEILARTGWTTGELATAMKDRLWQAPYDFVTLLIGVNNQYRGLPIVGYAMEFEGLLREAIRLTSPLPRVFVFSIPDWSVSPFADNDLPDSKGRDAAATAREIDSFNETAAAITRSHGLPFIDITTHSRTARHSPALFAADGLHPAATQYAYWAGLLAEAIRGQQPGAINKYC